MRPSLPVDHPITTPQQAPPTPVLASARRPFFILTGCFALLGGMGWLDYITGYELSFFAFYSLAIGIAAWKLGRWEAIAVAFGAMVAWWLADYYSGVKYSARFFYYWNNAVHLIAFLINAITIARIKADLDRAHRLALELETARAALRATAAMLTGCPACGKPHESLQPRPMVNPSAMLLNCPDLAQALCPHCRRGNAKSVTTVPADSATFHPPPAGLETSAAPSASPPQSVDPPDRPVSRTHR